MNEHIRPTNIKPSTLTKIMDTVQNNATHFSISQIKALERLIRIKNMEISGGELDGTSFILLPNNLGFSVQLIELNTPQCPYKVTYKLITLQ